ncbi:hypothetical protein [Emticicia sp. W12TSBA100-4]|uniref:hypothetical protein n=1 Tax=Emticicia sp. W12TSBA100-4 TaxID=3160965 RepID=UPI00330665DD
MKTIHYIFLFVSLSFFAQAQTIRRVTNDPNIPLGLNMYSTLQAAHDAATEGDIIYVQSSYQGASYGDLTSSKRLHIIGNGYGIDENKDLLGANAPYNTGTSIVGNVNLNFGDGTIIEGLKIEYMYARTRVILRRCDFYFLELLKISVNQDPSSSIISHSNIFGLSLKNNSGITTLNNITIANNIIRGVISGQYENESAISNIFIRNNYLFSGLSYMTNIQLHSNILHFTNSYGDNLYYTPRCPNKVGSNNVCIDKPCDVGSNNVNGPLDIALFGYANGGVPSIPRHHILSNSSPAKGAGLGGVDAGPFGTADPFRLSGLPAIPQITSYSSQISNSIYTPSTPMNVTISVRGNN